LHYTKQTCTKGLNRNEGINKGGGKKERKKEKRKKRKKEKEKGEKKETLCFISDRG